MSQDWKFEPAFHQDTDGNWHLLEVSSAPLPPPPPDDDLHLESVFGGRILAHVVTTEEGVGNMKSWVYGPLVYIGDSSYQMGNLALTHAQARQLLVWLQVHVPAAPKGANDA